MRYPHDSQIVWQFDTVNLRMICHAEPDEDLDLSFDDDGSVRAGIESGKYVAFCAFVSVWFGDDPDNLTYLAHDVLGGCIYSSVQEFITAHRDRDPMNRNCSLMRAAKGGNVAIYHYFPDMVRTAVQEARDELRRLQSLHIRAAQSVHKRKGLNMPVNCVAGPGLEFGNYYSSDYTQSVVAYRAELQQITKDLRHACELLRYVELHDSITAERLKAAFKSAYSGRLS